MNVPFKIVQIQNKNVFHVHIQFIHFPHVIQLYYYAGNDNLKNKINKRMKAVLYKFVSFIRLKIKNFLFDKSDTITNHIHI